MNGVTGATGLSGVTGATGLNGVTGATGLNGATGATGVNGVTGATGVNGVTGATGLNGVTGATGTSATSNSMYASNTSGATIVVLLGGTSVALPNNQILDGFTVDGSNTTFTVPVSGLYYVTYNLNTTASLLSNTRVLLNGSTQIPGSVLSPALAVTQFNNSFMVNLTAGNTLQLQFFGVVGTVVIVGGGATGAAFNIIRLS
ncbi:flagellar hook-length control protein FliK [Paenibacillus pini JCM 16418]|uniref:Flagellar hook-length control protein FliK n=1 Tax=Paenibacillus pini JCM 16418 TaxID=1236976 RepID=W7Z511_9BACL|nr:flagellar hook-length control protein FliK [Paenibacillus pini JCM 16418]